MWRCGGVAGWVRRVRGLSRRFGEVKKGSVIWGVSDQATAQNQCRGRYLIMFHETLWHLGLVESRECPCSLSRAFGPLASFRYYEARSPAPQRMSSNSYSCSFSPFLPMVTFSPPFCTAHVMRWSRGESAGRLLGPLRDQVLAPRLPDPTPRVAGVARTTVARRWTKARDGWFDGEGLLHQWRGPSLPWQRHDQGAECRGMQGTELLSGFRG